MNVSSMRRVDRWVGVPLCGLLTAWRGLTAPFRPPAPDLPRRILFVKLAEQGSTVLAAPAIRTACDLVGRDNVLVLCFRENRFILDAMDLLPAENVLTIPTGNVVQALFGALASVRRMHKAGIDAAVDLEFFARSSAALCWLSGARLRVGFHAYFGEGPWRGDLMTHRVSFNPHLHAAQAFAVMVQALTAPSERLPALELLPPPLDEPRQVFRPAPKEVRQVEELLAARSPTGRFRPLALLNPNCGDLLPLRSWPGERYVELARRLLARYPDLHVAFTGSPAEAAQTEPLAASVGSQRVICLAGATTLRQLLTVYTLSEVLVTNDSGPAHFASLTPADVVVLFGPETPRLFASPSRRTHVLWSGIACSPCVSALNDRRSACRDNRCMQRISVEQVFAEVCRVLDARFSAAAGAAGASGGTPSPGRSGAGGA